MKTFSLEEVIKGLKAGLAFERELENDGGMEYLSPADSGQFRHDVAGKAHGGWGGASTMPLSTLDNGRWKKDGWKRSAH